MDKPKKLIQSYVLEKFFISTAYRKCSADIPREIWYYETIVFSWDRETRGITGVVEITDSGSDTMDAFAIHNSICRRYLTYIIEDFVL